MNIFQRIEPHQHSTHFMHIENNMRLKNKLLEFQSSANLKIEYAFPIYLLKTGKTCIMSERVERERERERALTEEDTLTEIII